MPKARTGELDFITIGFHPLYENFRFVDIRLEGTDPEHQVMRLWTPGDAANGFSPTHVEYGHYQPHMVNGLMQLDFIATGERLVQGARMPVADGVIREADYLPVVNRILQDVPPVPANPIGQGLQVAHGLPRMPGERQR
jgi:hypothetical protein